MPYRLGKQEDQWCVFNKDTGESKGCSKTRPMAVKHMRALYWAEGKKKELNDDSINFEFLKSIKEYETEYNETIPVEEVNEALQTKEWDGDFTTAYNPYPFATSYADLEDQRLAQEAAMKAQELISEFPMLASNILADPEIAKEDKKEAIKDLGGELAERLPSTIQEELDGETKEKAITRREDVSEAEKKYASKKYGSVRFADPKNSKYPIDTEEHIRAAWNYINKTKNAAKYSASAVASIKRRIISAWKSKIDKAGPPSVAEKSSKWDELYAMASDLLSGILLEKEAEDNEPEQLMVWKEGNQYNWIAHYSNKFRDNDNPREILSDRSHRNFVERVEKGLAPYPEMQLWHRKEWTIGRATWVGYDDSGFAMAAGYIYPGCEPAAEWLDLCNKELAVSHGMPKDSVKYDPNDSTVIVEYTTQEISPLPRWAAANQLTGSAILKELDSEEEQANHEISDEKESDEMALTKNQKKELMAKMGLDEAVIEKIEKANAAIAQKASEAGIESKENENATPPTTDASTAAPTTPEAKKPEETPPAESTPKEPEAEVETTPTVKEIAEAVVALVDPIAARVEALENSTKELAESNKVLVEALTKMNEINKETSSMLARTPKASLFSVMHSLSAVGDPSTKVDSADPLANSKPKEAENTAPQSDAAIFPFLRTMLSQEGKK